MNNDLVQLALILTTRLAAEPVTQDTNLLQTVIVAVLSSGVVAGLFSLFVKRSRSPESQNELARLGNEFAKELLDEARTERTELKKTIDDLEKSVSTKQETIDTLKALLNTKDNRIEELERRRQAVAEKLQRNELITLADIFGKDAPGLNLIPVEQASP